MRPELVNRRPREITRRDFLRIAGSVFAGVGMNLLVNPQEADAGKGKGHNKDNKEKEQSGHNKKDVQSTHGSKEEDHKDDEKRGITDPHFEVKPRPKPDDDPRVCIQVFPPRCGPDQEIPIRNSR